MKNLKARNAKQSRDKMLGIGGLYIAFPVQMFILSVAMLIGIGAAIATVISEFASFAFLLLFF